MDLGLNSKVIIVTGGAKGIGEGICKLLANEGATVVVIGRNATDNQRTVDEIKNSGGNADSFAAELTEPAQCEAAVKYVADKYQRIDGLVNNAGVNDGVGLESGNYELFMRSIASQYGSLLPDGTPCVTVPEKIGRKHCKYHFKDCRNRPGKYLRIRSCQWRKECIDP